MRRRAATVRAMPASDDPIALVKQRLKVSQRAWNFVHGADAAIASRRCKPIAGIEGDGAELTQIEQPLRMRRDGIERAPAAGVGVLLAELRGLLRCRPLGT